MSLKSLFAAIVLFLAPASLLVAEPIVVRSGEHPGYTRLVIESAFAQGYRVGRDPTGYVLDGGAEASDGYDVKRALARMDRGRITGLTHQDGRLAIALGCTCHAEVFALPGARLVIDIKDGAPPDSSPFEASLDLPASDAAPEDSAESTSAEPFDDPFAPDAPLPSAPPLIAVDSTEDPRHLEVPVVEPEMADDLAEATDAGGAPAPGFGAAWYDPASPDGLAAGPGRALEPLAPETTDKAESLAGIEAMLAESLGRASAQGLVEAESQPAPDHGPEDAHTAEPSGEAAAETHMADAEPAPLTDGPQVTASTAIESAQDETRTPAPKEPGSCSDIGYLAFLEPSEAEERGEGEMLAALYDEDGNLRPAEALKLAQAYIAETRGAESLAVQRDIGLSGPQAAVLQAVALIVDDEGEDVGPEFQAFLACKNPLAMWAFLAQPAENLEPPPDIGQVLRSHAALPQPLRARIGELLSEAFLDRGLTDAAKTAASNAGVPADAGLAAHSTHDARVEAALGDHDNSREILGEVIGSAGPEAPEAMTELVTNKLAVGEEVSDHDMETLAALEGEAQDSAMAAPIAAATDTVLLRKGDYLAVLDRLSGRSSEADVELEAQAWEQLTYLGTDFDLLVAVRRWPERAGQAGESGDVGQRMAERLSGLGFGDAMWMRPVAADGQEATVTAPVVLQPPPVNLDQLESLLQSFEQERTAIDALLKAP